MKLKRTYAKNNSQRRQWQDNDDDDDWDGNGNDGYDGDPVYNVHVNNDVACDFKSANLDEKEEATQISSHKIIESC